MTAKLEPTRTRQQGTRVTLPTTSEERVAAIRRIVAEGQYAKVDGIMVDLFSASAILAVYDQLSQENRARYSALVARKMALVAFKLIKAQS